MTICSSIGPNAATRFPATTSSRSEESKPTLVKTVKRMLGFGEAPLIVKGHDDLLVYRAKCCNPIPGDDIIEIGRVQADAGQDRQAHAGFRGSAAYCERA